MMNTFAVVAEIDKHWPTGLERIDPGTDHDTKDFVRFEGAVTEHYRRDDPSGAVAGKLRTTPVRRLSWLACVSGTASERNDLFEGAAAAILKGLKAAHNNGLVDSYSLADEAIRPVEESSTGDRWVCVITAQIDEQH